MVMEQDYKPVINKSFVNKFNLNPTYAVANAAVCAYTRDHWCSMVLIDNHTYVRFVNPASLRSLLGKSALARSVCW